MQPPGLYSPCRNLSRNQTGISLLHVKMEERNPPYLARHPFSRILKRGGVPIAYISESPGHSDLRTTENYLGSFEDNQKKEFGKLLMPEK